MTTLGWISNIDNLKINLKTYGLKLYAHNCVGETKVKIVLWHNEVEILFLKKKLLRKYESIFFQPTFVALLSNE